MRVLALDIGQKRIGCAICDPQMRVATPLCVLPARDVIQKAPSFRRLLEDWEPEMLLCGLPYTLSHQKGPQAQRVIQIAEKIAQDNNLELSFCDERLSSQEAKHSLREKGFSEKEMRGKIDMIAASLFLQAWLDARISESDV